MRKSKSFIHIWAQSFYSYLINKCFLLTSFFLKRIERPTRKHLLFISFFLKLFIWEKKKKRKTNCTEKHSVFIFMRYQLVWIFHNNATKMTNFCTNLEFFYLKKKKSFDLTKISINWSDVSVHRMHVFHLCIGFFFLSILVEWNEKCDRESYQNKNKLTMHGKIGLSSV